LNVIKILTRNGFSLDSCLDGWLKNHHFQSCGAVKGGGMTKADFIEKLAEKGDTTKKHASEAVDLVFSAIAEVLSSGDEIAIPGFGKFSVAQRAARTGVNPQTKQKIRIEATKVPKFSAAKALKEAVK
jgi:nucleoid DNA-binding protein